MQAQSSSRASSRPDQQQYQPVNTHYLRDAQPAHADRLGRHLHRLQQARHQRRRKQLADLEIIRTG